MQPDSRPEPFKRWLEWLGKPDCSCKLEYKSIGMLYGVSMGKGWILIERDPNCPHDGDD